MQYLSVYPSEVEYQRDSERISNMMHHIGYISETGDVKYHTLQPIEFESDEIEAACLENFDFDMDGKFTAIDMNKITSLTGSKGFFGIGYDNAPVNFHELAEFKNLKTIESNAFDSSYMHISLPSSITSIENYAFDMRNMKSIKFMGDPYGFGISSNAFGDVWSLSDAFNYEPMFYVPRGYKDTMVDLIRSFFPGNGQLNSKLYDMVDEF